MGEYMESILFEQILKEVTYNWAINKNDRSWFITTKGDLLGGINHKLILKNNFKEEWDNLKSNGLEDFEIEKVFEDRFIKMGYVIVGEMNEFYSIIYKLDNRIKNALQGFAKSILKIKNVSNTLLTIHQKENNDKIKCTMGEIAGNSLFNFE